MALLVLLGLVVLVVIWIVSIYNGMVTLRNRFKNAFAQIDVQLKRRYDLIPNLIEVAKKYMSYERETLEAVIAARAIERAAARPEDGGAVRDLAGADAALTGTLGKLFAVVEAYPDLKANRNMSELQEELASTENRVAFARQAFNDAVMSYNTATEVFPGVLVARNFKFLPAQLFELEVPAERALPKVSLG